jgi:hypothetical protein
MICIGKAKKDLEVEETMLPRQPVLEMSASSKLYITGSVSLSSDFLSPIAFSFLSLTSHSFLVLRTITFFTLLTNSRISNLGRPIFTSQLHSLIIRLSHLRASLSPDLIMYTQAVLLSLLAAITEAR